MLRCDPFYNLQDLKTWKNSCPVKGSTTVAINAKKRILISQKSIESVFQQIEDVILEKCAFETDINVKTGHNEFGKNNTCTQLLCTFLDKKTVLESSKLSKATTGRDISKSRHGAS